MIKNQDIWRPTHWFHGQVIKTLKLWTVLLREQITMDQQK